MKDTELSTFERNILEGIIESKYSKLKEHIKRLKVKHRDKTGVGLFIVFDYQCSVKERIKIVGSTYCLSSEKILYIKGLNFPVNYELNVTDGKIDFLEIVTNGEQWNGEIREFRFEQ